MAVAPEARPAARLEPAAGDHAEQLFRRHSGWIYRHCLRRLGSPDEADDALMASYLNACASLQEGFTPRVESAWLFRIAENVCNTRLRSSARRARLERIQDVGLLEETVAAPERRTDELIGLTEALSALPGRQRRALVLREWRGLSYREVGAELSLSTGAVETLLFRARRSLAAALEKPERLRTRVLHGFGLPALLAGARSSLFESAGVGVKIASVAAVATTAVVVAADPVGWHRTPVDKDATAPAVVRSAAPVARRASAAPAAVAEPLRPTRVEQAMHPVDGPDGARAAAGQAAPSAGAPVATASAPEAARSPAKDPAGTARRERTHEGRAVGPVKGERAEKAPVEQGRPEPPPKAGGRAQNSAAKPAFAGGQGPPPYAQASTDATTEPRQKGNPAATESRATLDPPRRRSSAGRALHS